MTSRTPDRGKPAEYDQLIVQRRFRLLVERVRLDNALVLDFGCGNGAQTIPLSGIPCRVVAVDIDRTDLDRMVSRLRREGSANILTVQYDGRRLPLRDGAVDIVTSFEVLEHVSDDRETLCELARILRPEGEIVLSVPNKGWVFETHGARLPLLPWNRVPFLSWLPRSLHSRIARARIYRKGDIVRLLEDTGFSVCSTVYVTAPMDALGSRVLRRLARSTLFRGDTTRASILSTAILVHARRTG